RGYLSSARIIDSNDCIHNCVGDSQRAEGKANPSHDDSRRLRALDDKAAYENIVSRSDKAARGNISEDGPVDRALIGWTRRVNRLDARDVIRLHRVDVTDDWVRVRITMIRRVD